MTGIKGEINQEVINTFSVVGNVLIEESLQKTKDEVELGWDAWYNS